VRPESEGRDKQYETIYRNAASQCSTCFGRVVSREQQKDRTASDRIHDREERAHNQENIIGNLNHQDNLPSVSRFERLPQLVEPGLSFRGNLTADGHNINDKDRLKNTCPVPECEKEFSYMSNIGLNRVHDLVDLTRKD
jgi:hypothetical protein